MNRHVLLFDHLVGLGEQRGRHGEAEGPGGVEKVVKPGRKPLTKVFPPSVEVAKPILLAPPFQKRPTWKAETMMWPKAKVSGSTSVWWMLVALL